MIEVEINGKWPLKLPESAGNEWIGNMLWHTEWEGPRLDLLHKVITKRGPQIYNRDRDGNITSETSDKPGPIVLYVGAYKGDMAALLAMWGAKLMLVEGTEGFWPEIKETFELNELPKPLVMFSGLMGRESKNVQLYPNDWAEWPERTTEFIEGTTGFAHLAESGDVFPTVAIDELIKFSGVVPDIITMDIEGSEAEACYGALDTIIKHKPAFMLSVHPEFMFHNHNMYERELHDLLRNNGYIGEWIDYDHEHHWWYTHPEGFAG